MRHERYAPPFSASSSLAARYPPSPGVGPSIFRNDLWRILTLFVSLCRSPDESVVAADGGGSRFRYVLMRKVIRKSNPPHSSALRTNPVTRTHTHTQPLAVSVQIALAYCTPAGYMLHNDLSPLWGDDDDDDDDDVVPPQIQRHKTLLYIVLAGVRRSQARDVPVVVVKQRRKGTYYLGEVQHQQR